MCGAHLGVETLSTGEILRQSVAAGTGLGRRVAPILDSGELVPDELMAQLVESRMGELAAGFILDGYPRTVRQAVLLDEYLASSGVRLDAAVSLSATVPVVVERLLDRAAASGRSDDARDVTESRLSVFRRETAPVIEYYERRGILQWVDGEESPSRVTQAILSALS